MADCGCGGGSAAVTPSGGTAGTVFAIQLSNGTKVGSYPTRDHATVALQTTYAGNGKVVPK
jgi:hypothetical protein